MGCDKWSLPFGDGTLLDRVVARVRPAVDEVVVVAREGQEIAGDFRIVRDPAEGLGPLAGIAAGLRAIDAPRAFLTACDVPLLRTAYVRRLLELAEGHPLAVPVVDGFHMMTSAVYARTLLPAAEALMAAGRMRPLFLVEQCAARLVTENELRTADPELESFRNCNTMHEYETALRDAGCA